MAAEVPNDQLLLVWIDDRVSTGAEGYPPCAKIYRSSVYNDGNVAIDTQRLTFVRFDRHPVTVDHSCDRCVDRYVRSEQFGAGLHRDWIAARTLNEDELAAGLHVVDETVGGDVVGIAPSVAALETLIVDDGADARPIADDRTATGDRRQRHLEGFVAFDLGVVDRAEIAEIEERRCFACGDDGYTRGWPGIVVSQRRAGIRQYPLDRHVFRGRL